MWCDGVVGCGLWWHVRYGEVGCDGGVGWSVQDSVSEIYEFMLIDQKR